MKRRVTYFWQTFPDLQHRSLLEDAVNCCCVAGMSSPVKSVTPEVERGSTLRICICLKKLKINSMYITEQKYLPPF